MEFLESIIDSISDMGLTALLCVVILCIALWAFIKSAVQSGVKDAVYEVLTETGLIQNTKEK